MKSSHCKTKQNASYLLFRAELSSVKKGLFLYNVFLSKIQKNDCKYFVGKLIL